MMPDVSRLLSPTAESGPAPEKFEDLLARLEQIVSDMENAEMPLEKLLAGYEEGMRLVKACGDRLADAEQKVEILSRALRSRPKAARRRTRPRNRRRISSCFRAVDASDRSVAEIPSLVPNMRARERAEIQR